MTAEVLDIPVASFDRRLLEATEGLTSLILPAHEQGSSQIEPAHIVVALSRIRDGVAQSELDRRQIPAEWLAQALLQARGGAADPVTALDVTTASAGTVATFAALKEFAGTGGAIGESELLGHALLHLDENAVTLMRRFAKIDAEEWAGRLLAGRRGAPEIFAGEDKKVDVQIFTPGAQRVLATMEREAGALGHERLTTPLLLHTMAGTSSGLIEQALHFLQQDVRRFRERLFSVVGTRPGPKVDSVPLTDAKTELGLKLVLERAAATATARHSDLIAERDLLTAMLEIPGGVAPSFFRDVNIDTTRMLRFAFDYYREVEPESPAASTTVSANDAEAVLESCLLGQEAVVRRLIPHVRRIKMGLELGYRREANPSAALLFCGPSGTGKTMTARVLADLIYGSRDDVLMFEMGQFNSRESINNFIGAPPGYVGFGEGKLTNGLRDNPRRVLLFDEVEKADARVFDALLRLLDEGCISDPAGPVRDARDSVIVLTSNIGSKEVATATPASALAPSSTEGPTPSAAARQARLRQLLEEFFRPEFLNRVDEVVMFEPFGPDALRDIAQASLTREAKKAKDDLGITLTWGDDVPVYLGEQAAAYRAAEAARGVNRLVTSIVPLMLDIAYEARAAGRPAPAMRVSVRDRELAVEAAP